MPPTLFPHAPRMGFMPVAASAATLAANAAATYYALSFVARAKTVNSFRTTVSAVAGVLGAADVVCDLWDSAGASGAPGASIETGKTPTATVNAAGQYEWTGFNTLLSEGQSYWAVWRNVNGVPATNNCTFRQLINPAPTQTLGSANTRFMWSQASSTNSGASWAVNAGRSALRIGYSDGSYSGIPLSNTSVGLVTDGVYGSREYGAVFVSPPGASLNVIGLAALLAAKTGAPTGLPRMGLWTGAVPSLRGYTPGIPAASVTTSQWVEGPLAANVVIPPASVVRVTLGETAQADASGNRWNAQEFSRDTDAGSLPLLGWASGFQKTYFDGAAWTDTLAAVFGHALILDPVTPFIGGAVPSVVGSPIVLGVR